MAFQIQTFISWAILTIARFQRIINRFIPANPFYVDYFSTLDAISNGNRTIVCRLRFERAFLLGKAIHYLWLWRYQGILTPRGNLLHFNVMAIEHLPSYMCIAVACFALFAAQCSHFLYNQNSGLTLAILRQHLIENRQTIFIHSHYKFGIVRKFYKTALKTDVNLNPIWKNMQFFAILLRNGFKCFVSFPIGTL